MATHRARRLVLVAILGWCTAGWAFPWPEDANRCVGTFGSYADLGYVVRAIRVAPLVGILPNEAEFRDALVRVEDNLKPLDTGQLVDSPLSLRRMSNLQEALRDELENRQLIGKTGFQFIAPAIRNCNASANPPTLEIEYRILSLVQPSSTTINFESDERTDREKERDGQAGSSAPRIVFKTLAGYNPSRKLFGGARFAASTGAPVFQKIDLMSSGSGSSRTGDGSLFGSRDFGKGALDHIEWRLGYTYSRIESDNVKLRQGTLLGQFFGSTRPVGAGDLIFRIGTSIEGGNRQADSIVESSAQSGLPHSGYRAVKFYVGESIRVSRGNWKASYGLLLGNAGEGIKVDFVKHIFDSAYQTRILPRDHMPLHLATQVTGGWLQGTSGRTPVAEHFFGGNVQNEFIKGDTWRIGSSALIRSFPENRLGGAGGTNFLSMNVTLAQTIWGRELLPPEITHDATLLAALEGQLMTARGALTQDETADSDQVRRLRDKMKTLGPRLDNLRTVLDSLNRQIGSLPAEKKDQILQLIAKFDEADPDTGIMPISNIRDAIEDDDLHNVERHGKELTEDDADMKALIKLLREAIANLRTALNGTGLPDMELATADAGFARTQTEISTAYRDVEALEAYAASEVESVLRTLKTPVSGSGATIDQILDRIRQQLAPITIRIQTDLHGRPSDTAADITRRQRLLEMQTLLESVETYAEKASAAFGRANDALAKHEFESAKHNADLVVLGFGGAMPSYISGLDNSVQSLQKPMEEERLSAEWGRLHALTQSLLRIQAATQTPLKGVRIPISERRANRTVDFIGRLFDVFFRELNLVGVSPLLLLDAARVGSGIPNQRDGFRYGMGTGIRFALINVNFDAGYSFNLKRLPGEPRGAFVFALDIGNIFN